MITHLLRRKHAAVALTVLALSVAGCGYDDTAVPDPPAAAKHTPAEEPDCTTDESTLESVPASSVAGDAVAAIRERGLLRVGVSADTYLMASRNPKNNRIEGFDIEVVKAIGRQIFGDGFNVNVDVQLKVITAADRIPALENDEVDLVVRNFTINCTRKVDIDFSAVYYEASQKVLVPLDAEEAYIEQGDDWLAGKKVCAPTGSTSLDNIEDEQPDVEIVPASTHTGCLIKFQRGDVDAITGDDTVLAGLAAQDPYAVVPEQDALTTEPYGVGVKKGSDLVAYVNYALEQMVSDGTWESAYRRWLRPELGELTPPSAITAGA